MLEGSCQRKKKGGRLLDVSSTGTTHFLTCFPCFVLGFFLVPLMGLLPSENISGQFPPLVYTGLEFSLASNGFVLVAFDTN